MGVDVPSAKIGDENGKPYQLTDYIDGVQLGKLPLDEFDKIAKQLRDVFIVDAWLGNWDVIGANYDNIIVKDGKAYRVDNGSAGFFRAQGSTKMLDDTVNELDNSEYGQRSIRARRRLIGLVGNPLTCLGWNRYGIHV
jgi:predicted Ser/Thr protein kinase